jgi:hypothetical protein
MQGKRGSIARRILAPIRGLFSALNRLIQKSTAPLQAFADFCHVTGCHFLKLTGIFLPPASEMLQQPNRTLFLTIEVRLGGKTHEYVHVADFAGLLANRLVEGAVRFSGN